MLLDKETDRDKERRRQFESFSKEALAYFIVHEVIFLSSSATETLQEIERRLALDKLLKRMHDLNQELQSIGAYKTRRQRDRYFKLHDEFELVSKRIDRIHKQQDQAHKKFMEKHYPAEPQPEIPK